MSPVRVDRRDRPRNSGDSRKAELRRQERDRRRSLAPQQRESAARRAARCLLADHRWQRARSLALYFACDGELDPGPVLAEARARAMAVFLPVVLPRREMVFAEWCAGEPLQNNRYGIPEPDRAALRAAPGDIDLMLVPCVAFSAEGQRLGMGAGYYDRALSRGRPHCVLGYAYAAQQHAQLPEDPWDQRLDGIVTERGLVAVRRA